MVLQLEDVGWKHCRNSYRMKWAKSLPEKVLVMMAVVLEKQPME